MNLHIVPDNVFINGFIQNLTALGIIDNNKIVVRSNTPTLKYITYNVPFAPLYSAKFSSLTGDTNSYEKVFIHLFSPLMYRWVATHKFNELNWMIWGTDLYNLPSLNVKLYDDITLNKFVRKNHSIEYLLYRVKVAITNAPFRDIAYAKVKNVLTWMKSEYNFACQNLKTLQADHQFFFYENQLPYQKLDVFLKDSVPAKNKAKPLIIVGNSAAPSLNHLDAIQYFQANKIAANLLVPVSYGEKLYKEFLKRNVSFYTYGSVDFMDTYMDFNRYLEFLSNANGIVMYNRRPQGYGNILMMLYLGKPVFLHEHNISLADLDLHGVKYHTLQNFPNIMDGDSGNSMNRVVIAEMFSHERLLNLYQQLF
jgi:hypothetical protein